MALIIPVFGDLALSFFVAYKIFFGVTQEQRYTRYNKIYFLLKGCNPDAYRSIRGIWQPYCP